MLRANNRARFSFIMQSWYVLNIIANFLAAVGLRLASWLASWQGFAGAYCEGSIPDPASELG